MDYSTLRTTARVREWQYLTGADFASIDREKTVVMVTCSPLEVHGPHLPVVTDTLEAEALSLRTMELLCERHDDIQFLHLPPIYTAADVLPHRGSVAFRASTIVRTLADLGRSLGKQGFRDIWVGNFHGGPRHFVAIEMAAERANRRWGTRMVSVFSLLVKRLTGGGSDLRDVLATVTGLSRETLAGDTHGGAVETSLMLHLLGDRVDPAFRALARRTIDLKLAERGVAPLEQGRLSALVRGLPHKLKYYEDETYSGAPAAGSAELGAKILDDLAGRAADALGEVWRRELSPAECHSPLWPVRHLLASRTIAVAVERAVGFKSRVF